MKTGSHARTGATDIRQETASQYGALLDGWAEVSKGCLTAANDMYRIGIKYCRDEAKLICDVAVDPENAARARTYSSIVKCHIDAVDQAGHAYLESLANVGPLMKLVEAQMPTLSKTLIGGIPDVPRLIGPQEGLPEKRRSASA